MAKVIVTESSLENIADAIRAKLETQTQYKPNQMASAIAQIHGNPVLETLSATANGTYNPSSGKDGFSQAVVNVPNSYTQSDEGKVVSSGALVAQTSQSITQNGTYDTTLNDEVVVNVAGGGEPSMPSEYQEVEYISCTDYQGITISDSLYAKLIKVDVSFDSISSGETGFAGQYIGGSSVEFYQKNGKIYVYGNSPSIDKATITNVVANQRYSVGYVFVTANTNFSIGYYRTDRYPFAGKIYRAEIEDVCGEYPITSNKMILRPCYRKSDNVIGMYDVVNDVFYTNTGSGSFGKGADV